MTLQSRLFVTGTLRLTYLLTYDVDEVNAVALRAAFLLPGDTYLLTYDVKLT